MKPLTGGDNGLLTPQQHYHAELAKRGRAHGEVRSMTQYRYILYLQDHRPIDGRLDAFQRIVHRSHTGE